MSTTTHVIHVLWGSSPEEGETSQAYHFASVAESDAFLQAAQESQGWQGYQVVDAPGFIDHEGQFQPYDDPDGALAADGMSKEAPFVLRVVWGESPEPGTEPDTYWFATEAEVQAFILGAAESQGNEDFELVDGPGEVNEDGEFALY